MAKKQETGPKFRERTGDLFQFVNEGDQIVGVLEALDSVQINNKDVGRMHIRTPDDKVNTVLQTVQMEACIHDSDIGKAVRITRGAEIKTGSKRTMINYRVEVEE